MRLPAYRSSYMLRYHPYPRLSLSHHETLMDTVDERDSPYGESDYSDRFPALFQLGAPCLPTIDEYDEAAVNLEAALAFEDKLSFRKKIFRRRFVHIVLDLALSIKRKLKM
ncbi:hypothetical protein SERLADRAFT_417169 [Serpula lacrymans var. lacrymans S7.9]|uniref:Uncharacterized protein n=1 Tax=Serpula lacrymans var. lacrymans (strain S7.9) TaxID=578457 RepID=F8P4Y5_SERL9|nr:uncharacterized protein SERLADRAFT_417169 [Serpula lacrymans var. lacrymans S7.9]EGO21672.1 hypothetical protein SERLADRAFT_417169 [Serpula lacrymans var. lacrymans S7.9]